MSDHLCYLRDSSIYVHGTVATPPLTYVGRGRFQHGPLTMFQVDVTQMWYLVSVTS